jgi:hypothetical protein
VVDSTTVVPGDERCGFLCPDCDQPLFAGPERAAPPAEPDPTGAALPAAASHAGATPVRNIVPGQGKDLDECEVLLERAIAMVRGPIRGSSPPRGLTEGGAAARELGRAFTVRSAPSTSSAALATESDRDACEVLLKRAIEMVRGPKAPG